MGSDEAAGDVSDVPGWRTDRAQNEASCVVFGMPRMRPHQYGWRKRSGRS